MPVARFVRLHRNLKFRYGTFGVSSRNRRLAPDWRCPLWPKRHVQELPRKISYPSCRSVFATTLQKITRLYFGFGCWQRGTSAQQTNAKDDHLVQRYCAWTCGAAATQAHQFSRGNCRRTHFFFIRGLRSARPLSPTDATLTAT